VRANFNTYLFNPVFWHIWDALHNPNIRKIMVRGGSSASKTFSCCDALQLHQLEALRNVFALRKHRIHVETTIKKSFEVSNKRLLGLEGYFNNMDGEIRVATGAITMYSGMDDSEKVKGIESYDIVYMNELNQFEPGEWDEVNRRLRGRPNQKILADWNPIISTHWINSEILVDSEGWIDLPLDLPEYEAEGAFTKLTDKYSFKKINAAGDTLWINVTYRDNFWIVGHPGNTIPAIPGQVAYQDADPSKPITLKEGMFVAPDGNLYGFIDIHTLANFEKMKLKKPNDYRIYGMGQDGLIRTGGEAWKCYSEERHVRDLQLDINEIIHLSLDKNVVPYITVAAWQVIPLRDKGITEIRQVHEIPCRSPENTAFRAAIATGKWLDRIGYKGTLFVYGDFTATARSTEDDEGRSFFDKYIGTLEKMGFRVVSKVERPNPAVAMSIDFVNDVYDELIGEYRIVIDTLCSVSREDYALVKQDPKTGALLKELVEDPINKTPSGKPVKYQKYGHYSDQKRYFIIAILFALFLEYKKGSRTPRILSVPE
jgi:phage terminase large subunit